MKSDLSQTELARRCFSAAKEYAELYDGSTPHALYFNERLRLVRDFLAPIETGTLLDVGCGPGLMLNRLVGSPLEMFGLDLSPEMIAEARTRTAGHNVALVVGQLERLPYRNKSFDVILGLGVLEYLPDQRAGLGEIARVAKDDAVVILSMVNRASVYRWWERFIFKSWVRLRSLLRGRPTRSEPKMWLQSESSLARMMKACQLEPIDALYFDLNVCVAPFDLKYPRQASVLNHWLKSYCGHSLFPLLHTAFLMRARRSA